ncbi:hypothetical protein ANCCEY_12814 [Ancylostoma ceylanicum]|uniref:Uncharacterized protein n=1 Tax=Ancylostoma ceylanicum TaxID=53326 RepID=A0A0D6LKC9_9BILA|nr:hypothetical protein ANCCEY_12814 [Ancylostoma ceylanicum]
MTNVGVKGTENVAGGESESTYKCYLNPLFSHEDLTDHSVASLAVIMRLGLPALLHLTGSFISCLAFVLGVTGHLRKTCYTLLSCINYICGSESH